MIQADFLKLQKGDRVKHVQHGRIQNDLAMGKVLVRTPSWMDDDKTVKFTSGDHSFFLFAEQVELV